jgi:hypothetical protein
VVTHDKLTIARKEKTGPKPRYLAVTMIML